MTTVLDVLQKELETDIENYIHALTRGQVEDYAGYKQLVGTITGLSLSLNRVKDLQKYNEDD